VDNSTGFLNTYPLDSAIHRLNNQQGLLNKFRLNCQTEMELHNKDNCYLVCEKQILFFFITCCKASVCLGPVKRATRTDFVEKSRTFWKDFSQPAQPNLLEDRFASWVVKRTSSFCSNVVKQVALFMPVLP